MITLKKGDVVMRVASELQASVFLRNGYERVDESLPAETPVKVSSEDPRADEAKEEPKKRRRRKPTE